MKREGRNNDGCTLTRPVVQAVVDLWHQSGKTNVIMVSGQSMRPSIRSGDRLLVSHDKHRARIGDVIIFYQEDMLVAHRVIKLKKRQGKTVIITKGDNTPKYDPPVSPQDIVGRAFALERRGERLSLNTSGRRISGWYVAATTIVCKKWALHRQNYRATFRRAARRCRDCLIG